jgi:acyl-[acyl-carrier-protein]-phospholipid O-acyltransferase/long-chain-fatty-acid--[acyl-carrier-protein] ligase
MLSPSKYGIIPELVPKEAVSKANGLITSFTYLAMIIGTFLASFLTQVTNRRFILIAVFCLLMAFLGFIGIFGVKYTYPQGAKKKISFFFIREIFQTLKFCRGRKHLLVSIFAAAFFLFIGAFTQLNIIPFGIQSLHLTPEQGGYLFLSTALGIAIGSFLSGKASKKRVELGLSCLAALFITLLFFLIAIFSHFLIFTVICLVLLGISGGLFIIPFDTYNQLESTDEKRGQVIATANFFSFCGVLLASFSLYFLNKILGFSAACSFAMIGLFSLLIFCVLIFRLSDYCFSFLARKLIKPFYKLEIEGSETVKLTEKPIFILLECTWKKAALLLSLYPQTHFLIPKGTSSLSWLIRPLFSVREIAGGEKYMLEVAKKINSEEIIPCLCLDQVPLSNYEKSRWEFLKKRESTLIIVNIQDKGKPSKVKIEFSPLNK